MDAADISRVPAEVLRNVEADTYWCMSKLLDGIQVSPWRPGPQAGAAPYGKPVLRGALGPTCRLASVAACCLLKPSFLYLH